jgi:RHS repeat-associated protein
MKKATKLHCLFIILLQLLLSLSAWAGVDPPVIKVLDGNLQQIKVDSFAIAEDPKFFDTVYNTKLIKPYKVQNLVTLKINEAANYFLQAPFTATVVVRVISTRANNSVDSVDKTLTITYDATTTYTSKSSYSFSAAYRVKVKVVSISTNVAWNVWQSLYVTNELQSFPAYAFSCTNDAIQSVSNTALPSNTTADELPVTWPNNIAADEYDLEWTYVDSSALASGRYGNTQTPDPLLIFDNNATRVTITTNAYNIPLIYDGKGNLFYRVRAVQTTCSNVRIETNWSSNYTVGLGNFLFDGHQTNLNWQATTSYAEEGKRKVVVQYFDGTLRGRQTVTKDNSTNTTVVAESFYDYQGRPVIQVLPTPTLNNVIKYSQNFNIGINGSAYDKDNFDYLVSPSAYCTSRADAMDTISGASQYYSPANPQKVNGFNQFIPDAKGYPFTEVEYVQDNTGRIGSQSGVGPTYALKSGHDTKHFYGTPDQKELDALFGTEVGYYTHYFKTMVRDANGQYSVSYVDMHGRTIATALAGSVPDSIKLDTLSSKNTRSITENLADSNNAVIKDLVMESKKSLLVSKPGIHDFSYQMNPQSLQLNDCNQAAVCYDCLYDLEISITDDCNNQKLGGSAFDTTIRNFSLAAIDTTCAGAASFSLNFSKFLEEGNYEITKKLSVSRAAIDYYRDSIFLKKNICKTPEQFIEEQRQLIATGLLCKPTCQSCTDSLGTFEQFRVRFMTQSGISVQDSASYRYMAIEAFEKAKADCDELCNNNTEAQDIRRAMLFDLTPPSGQYANIDSSEDKYSIFYVEVDANDIPSIANYRKPTNYLDADGKVDTVYDEQAGTFVFPQELGPESFAQKFKLSWAEALLPYHPEYCKLQQYEQLTLSHEWDKRFEETDTYDEALQKGYLNPTNNNTLPFSKYNGTGQIDPDPLAATYSNGSNNYKTKLETQLNEYRDNNINGSNGLSMWSIAAIGIMCQDQSNQSCFTTYGNNGFDTTVMCAGDRDMAWRTFRQMYLTIKREIINTQIKSVCNGQAGGEAASTLVAANHQPHFSDAVELLQANGVAIPTNSSELTASQQSALDGLDDYYTSNCLAYVTLWWQQLKPCNYASIDSAVIIPRLVQVCKEGSDATHPAGASSVKPSSVYAYKSFDDVLKGYADSSGRAYNTSTCNVNLIAAPLPYQKLRPYSDLQVWTKPDSCQCTRISVLNSSYQLNSLGYSSFSAYVNGVYNTNMTEADLQTLLQMCTASSQTCTYLPQPITIPVQIQCGSESSCIDCKTMAEVYSQFLAAYPDAHKISADDSATKQVYYDLLASYFNSKLGFTKTYQDYKQFLSTCSIPYYLPSTTVQTLVGPPLNMYVSGTDISSTVSCDTLNSIISQFNNLFPGLSNWNFVSKKVKRILYPKIEYLLSCSGITKPYPTQQTVNPPYWIGSGLRDSGYSSLWYRNNLTFVRFDVREIPSKATVDSANLKMSPVLTEPFDPGIYWSDMSTNWDTTLTCGQLSSSFHSGPLSVFTPGYQYTSSQGNLVYTYLFKNKYQNYFKFPWFYKGNLLHSILNPATQASNSATFVGTNNLIAQNDPEAKPRLEVWLRVDTLYSCKDLVASFFNSKLNSNLTYAGLQSLYLQKCGVSLPVTCSADSNTAKLCGWTEPIFSTVDVNEIDNCSDTAFFAISKGQELYNSYRDSLIQVFDSSYRTKCLQAYKLETFTVTHQVSEYHYTLYYYDQAGNLVKTIPPEGVVPNNNTSFLDSVKNARAAGTVKLPNHYLLTQYRYNTLNGVIAQQTPDAGSSNFWYDRVGRLAISQNSYQRTISATENNRLYSYTLYDALGRIMEVGQIKNATTKAMHDSISRRQASLNTWITNSAANKAQITQTIYDIAYAGFTGITPTPTSQANLRNRVSYSSFTTGSNAAQYNQATFYSYDFHGNVDTLLQDYGSSSFTAVANVMNANGNRFKKIVYRYDLISGKVNHVAYQPGQADQMYHRYSYDAENRITLVETSYDSVYWEKDARYQYYKHGPLARTVLGDQQVQGIDYAYTLQGWLKGINSTSLNPDYDMSNDGKVGAQYQYVARDAYGLNLNYFTGDYSAINNGNPFAGSSAYLGTAYKPLYNGNISSMGVNIGKFANPLLYAYTYDQLNRLTGMDAFKGLNETTNSWSGLISTQEYKERITYDANGNITKYLRNGFGSNLNMDSLTYNYNKTGGRLTNNQLNYVRDNVAATHYTVDIDNQSANNYVYDSIGNLTKDVAESITNIVWNVYGKISQITRTSTAANPVTDIQYTYDASGNRISKRVQKGHTSTDYTWYVRDAQGNLVATYISTGKTTNYSSFPLTLTEQHLYGSSRLGVIYRNVNMKNAFTPPSMLTFTRGSRYYELSNHLQNVLVTISDKKTGVDESTDGTIDYYLADVISAQDYYPFGMLQPSRQYGQLGRYGFNGKENDNEVKGEGNQQDYGMRIYDPRLGKFLSVDPITKKYPELTPYQFASNRPIDGIDMDGLEYVKRIHTVNPQGLVISTKDIVYYTKSEQEIKAMGGTTAGSYNSAAYGPEGKGIKHEYYLQNGDKSNIKDVWELPGSYATHGLYSGDGSITYTGQKDANGKKGYDYSWVPIDAVDAIAKRHDIHYTNVGAYDVVEDSRTLFADLQMVDEATQYLKSVPFRLLTGQRVAGETIVAATGQKTLMSVFADYKEWKQKYMTSRGMNPTSEADNKIVSLDSWYYRLKYINSDKKRRRDRVANLVILLGAKSKTGDDKKKE